MSQDLVDLEELVKEWVRNFPLDKSQRREADDILSSDINWKHVRIRHERTSYSDILDDSTPKSHVLFTANFTNNTDLPQTYSLKTERRTRSTCALFLEKGYCIGAEVNIKLVPPNPIIEANAGFHGELSLTRTSEETFEEELVWSIDNQINVPAHFKTKARLIIREDQYKGIFTSQTVFEGKVHVTLRNRKDNTPITTLSSDVSKLFTPNKGFKKLDKGVAVINVGRCRCKFGIEQHVQLDQEDLLMPGLGVLD